LLLLLICLLPVADGQKPIGWCGSDHKPAPPTGKAHFKLSAEMEKAQQSFGFHPITIPVVFHYIKIKGSNVTAATAPSYERLQRSIYATNLAYTAANAGFLFSLNSTLLFHEEPSLESCDDRESIAGKYAVRFATTLNIYLCELLIGGSDSVLGVGTFPYLYDGKANTTSVFLKPSQIVSLQVPFGGPTDPLYSPTFVPEEDDPNNNVGTTIFHEIGHWLGMFHPFQGDCGCCSDGDDYCLSGASSYCQNVNDPSSGTCAKVCGDSVADTPAVLNPQTLSASDQKSCKYDSCPELPGADDSLNYMSYDSVLCQYFDGALRGHFTFGQVVRARTQMLVYRKEFFPDIFPVGGRKTWTKSYSKQPVTAAQSKSNSVYPSFKKSQNVRKLRKLRKQ